MTAQDADDLGRTRTVFRACKRMSVLCRLIITKPIAATLRKVAEMWGADNILTSTLYLDAYG
jgi:hypothetical protein